MNLYKAPEKLKNIFLELLNQHEHINITAHPEDIGAISNYMDYFLEECRFFRNNKFYVCGF